MAAAAAAALLAGAARRGSPIHRPDRARDGRDLRSGDRFRTGSPDEPSPTAEPPRHRPTRAAAGSPLGKTAASDARLGAAPPRQLPAPTRFEIDRLEISMRVRPVGVATDGQMALPPSPADMGWYEYGPRPGDTEGRHRPRRPPRHAGLRHRPSRALERLRKGDLLTVRSGSTVRRYRVTQVTRLEKEGLDLEAIFDRTGPARLHVVTCGGRFDPATRTYEENLVVVGVPLG